MRRSEFITWSELKVGVLVTVALALFLIALFTLGGRVGVFSPKYTLYTLMPTVSGLSAGAPVRLAGVDVGSVGSVRFIDDHRTGHCQPCGMRVAWADPEYRARILAARKNQRKRCLRCGENEPKVSGKYHAVEATKRIVDRAMDLSGGAGMFKGNELERLYRDARCGGFHPANAGLVHELVGKSVLGILGAEPRF